MKTTTGDLFSQECDAICITTNLATRQNGNGIMGAGVALQARSQWPQLEEILGWAIKTQFGGQGTFVLAEKNEWITTPPYAIISLPTKTHWRTNASLDLIESSIKQLVDLTTERDWNSVYLTPPGCHNGHRDYRTEIEPILLRYLDSRFTLITPIRSNMLY